MQPDCLKQREQPAAAQKFKTNPIDWRRKMELIVWSPFLITLLLFVLVMVFNPRSLWSGFTALLLIGGTGLSILFEIFYHSEAITQNEPAFILLLIALAVIAFILLLFPAALFLLFFIEGIRLIRKEGLNLTNCLSLGFSLLILFVLFLAPFVQALSSDPLFSYLYLLASLTVTFFSGELAIFFLSAFVNLIHPFKRNNLNQIVVLGSGVFGETVPPLLAARIQKGIDLQLQNPDALLILSGGQGPGEDIPEGRAMRRWALEHGADPSRTISEERSRNTEENLLFSRKLFLHPEGKTAVVSTSYHVFRALLLAKEQNLACTGYGAKTKWYFAINAFLREFIAYLFMTKRKQLKYLLLFLSPYLLFGVIGLIGIIFR